MSNYSKTNELISTVRGYITECADLVGDTNPSKTATYGFTPGLNMSNEYSILASQDQKLKEGIFQVLFTGTFNCGKSTILNALMSKKVLRSEATAETAVITKIVFEAEEKVIVYHKEIDKKSGQMKTEEMTIKNFFEKYRVDQDHPEIFESVDHVVLQQPQSGLGGSAVQMIDSPGTENSKSDDKVAREFAEKASAIVFLISALQPFTFDDKEYIRTHFEGRGMKNVFFVVNKTDLLNSKEDFENVRNAARNHLSKVFTDENGRFDEDLYNKRVFFTSAFPALEARLGNKRYIPGIGEMPYDVSTTGIPEFERGLEAFLTDSNRDKEALAAFLPKMARTFANAKKKVAEELKKYSDDADKIKAEQERINETIKQVNRVLEAMEETFSLASKDMLNGIKRAYDDYVQSIDNGWSDYFSSCGAKLSIPNLISLATTKDEVKKKQILAPLTQEVETYMKSKTPVLESSMTTVVTANLKKLEDAIENYEKQLSNIDSPIDLNELIAKALNIKVDNAGSGAVKINKGQMLLGILGGDIDIMLGATTGSTSNKEAITKFIVRNVLEFVALEIVAWPIGLIMLIFRGKQIIDSIKNAGKDAAMKVFESMKPGVISELKQNGKNKIMMDVEKNIGGGLLRASNNATESIRNELATAQKSYDEIIKNLESATFNLSDETARFDNILAKLASNISEVSVLTTGKKLSADEIIKMA